MTYRVRNIAIAVVLAALAAVMTSVYVASYKKRLDGQQKSVSVWVASRDLPAGTPGSDVTKALTEKHVAKKSVVPGAISSPDQVKDKLTSQAIYAGEQVTTRRFSTRAQVGVRAKLKANVRAISIQGSSDQLLAGTLRTGDHVDVLGTFKVKKESNNTLTYVFTRTVLRDVEVLRAPDGPAPGSKLSNNLNQMYSVMLAVTDAQANKLWFTATNASGNNNSSTVLGWSLDLRAPVDSSDSPENVETVASILKDGLTPRQVHELFGPFGGQ